MIRRLTKFIPVDLLKFILSVVLITLVVGRAIETNTGPSFIDYGLIFTGFIIAFYSVRALQERNR